MSDFSDRPLVMGSLTGVRSFKVDRLGRLTGVSYQEVWKPGINRAGCGRTAASMDLSSQMFGHMAMTVRMSINASRIPGRSPAPVSLVKTEHRAGQHNCNCGYYAYFDNGTNPHHGDDQVVGIVDAHGVITVGSRGFRAEKAEIVALVQPPKRDGWPLDGLAGKLYPVAPPLAGWSIALGLLSIFWAIYVASPILSPLLGLAALATLLLGGLCFRSITVHYAGNGRERTPFDLVRANYPTVPVYRSKQAALRAHPLTPPPPPVIPTAETDPDFWTRSAR